MTASAAVLFILSNAAALFLAAVFASTSCRDRSLPVRWTALFGSYLLITSLTTLALGLFGILKPWSPCAVVVVASLIVGLVRRKRVNYDLNSLLPPIDAAAARCELKTLLTPMLALVIGLASIWVVKYTLLGTFLTFDDKTYHAPSLVQWMLSGRIDLTPFSYQSYYPFNAELLPLWFMMPFGNDAAVPLTALVYGGLFISLSLEFGRRWNLPLWSRLVPTILFLSSTEIVGQCNWFADVDIAAPVTLLAALAIGCRDTSPARRRQVIIAGAFAGFAVGMKSTFAPLAGILMIMVASRIFLRSRISDGRLSAPPSVKRLSFFGTIANGLSFFIAATCAGAYWYVRNILLTGNPLYPAKIGPFAGPFGGREQYATTLASAIEHGDLGVTEYTEIAELLFAWPATHAMLAFFAIVVSVLAVVRLRLGSRGVPAATAVTLTVFAVVCVSLFPWMPFSARGDDGNFYLKGSSRYLTLAYLCGFLLLPRLLAWIESPVLGRREQWAIFLGLMLLLTVPIGLAIDPLFACAALGVALICHVILQVLAYQPQAITNRISSMANHPAVWLSIITLAIAAAAFAAPFSLHSTDRMHHETWMNAQIDKLPEGSRVAMYFGLRPEFYTLYGRRFQHEPLRLSADGTPAVALHERDDMHGGRNFFDYAFDREVEVDPNQFLSNLRESQVDFVVTPSMPHRGDAWPTQHAWLSTLDILIFAKSKNAVIWDLRPAIVAEANDQ